MTFKYLLSLALVLMIASCGPLTANDTSNLHASVAPSPNDLVTAVRNNDFTLVRALLAKGSNPNTINANGIGALHYAATLGNLEIATTLVNAGAYINSQPNSRFPSALHMAAQGGNPKIVQLLLSKGAKINAPWMLNGHTPLIEAAFDARVDVVALLLRAGADTSGVTLRGLSASDLAAREADRNPDMKTILDMLNTHHKKLGLKADDKGRYDFTPEQKSKRLNALLNIIDPPHILSPKEVHVAELQKRLQVSAEQGDLAAVKKLVEVEKADVNTRAGRLGSTPLILASVAGKEDVVAYLLAKGANPNRHELHPMAISALFKASVFGHTGIARRLLQAGSLVNEQGPANGMTPLHDAVFRRRADVTKLLLSFGADPNIKDYTGRTAKDLAKGSPEMQQIFN